MSIPLQPRRHRILLEELSIEADVGFHDFEVGVPQPLTVSVDVTIDLAHWPAQDSGSDAWNYDFIRGLIRGLVAGRRYNLQETLAADIFRMIAERPGVVALSVHSRKTGIYPDARAVGVILSSE